MPKSKRDKKISLTKTGKKGLESKQHLVKEIQASLAIYKNIFVFTTPNLRNTQLKNLRDEWKENSRFFFGKNKVMALGLGRKKSEELQKDLHLVSGCLKGQCGLLFTDKPKEYVTEYFNNFLAYDHARSGFVSTKTITLPEGPLSEFSFCMEPQLRQLGLPTSLQRGVVALTQEYTVCKEGKALTPEQARILKLIDNKMAEFKVTLLCSWSKQGFESYTENNLKSTEDSNNTSNNEPEEETMEED